MACKHCADIETGECLFPYQGLAPHSHDKSGKTVLAPREEWPDNFVEDSDPNWSGTGFWTHCPKCGDGCSKKLKP